MTMAISDVHEQDGFCGAFAVTPPRSIVHVDLGLLERVGSDLRALTGRAVRAGLVDEEVRELVGAVARLADDARAALRSLTGDADQRGLSMAVGLASTARWLEHQHGLRFGAAQRLLEEHRLLERLDDDVAKGVVGLGAAKASLLLGAVNERTVDAFVRDAEALVTQLGRVGLAQVPGILRIWKHVADADGPDPALQRTFRLQKAWDTWVGELVLDDEAGLLVKAAVDHRARQLRDDDKAMPEAERRTWGQLRADAVVELLVKGGAVADGVRTPTPTVTVTAQLEDLEAGTGVGTSVDRRTVLPMDVIRRMACGGRWRRILFGAPSVVLDLGRSTSDVSPAQRSAGAVADAVCRWAGCARAAEACDQHHLDEWEADHGPTDQRNLVSLCRFHHGVAHKDGWKLRRDGDGTVVAVRRRDGLTLVDPPLPPPGTLPLVAA
jgi:hypothetical protein